MAEKNVPTSKLLGGLFEPLKSPPPPYGPALSFIYIRDRSLITSQGGGGGGGGFQKSVVFQNCTPQKNFEVKIIPPFPILV